MISRLLTAFCILITFPELLFPAELHCTVTAVAKGDIAEYVAHRLGGDKASYLWVVRGKRSVKRYLPDSSPALQVDLERGTLLSVDFEHRTFSTVKLAEWAKAADVFSRGLTVSPQGQPQISSGTQISDETSEFLGQRAQKAVMTFEVAFPLIRHLTIQKGTPSITATTIAELWTVDEIPGYRAFVNFDALFEQLLRKHLGRRARPLPARTVDLLELILDASRNFAAIKGTPVREKVSLNAHLNAEKGASGAQFVTVDYQWETPSRGPDPFIDPKTLKGFTEIINDVTRAAAPAPTDSDDSVSERPHLARKPAGQTPGQPRKKQ